MPTTRSFSGPFKDPERIQALLEAGFGGGRILVIGDLMLDRHVWGTVSRISPEAPVPVVRTSRQTDMAGGCGNVAMNLVGLGANVSIVSLLGQDAEGELLRKLLVDSGIDTKGIMIDSSRPTTTKTRILGGHQQMLRLDSESTAAPDTGLEELLVAAIRELTPGVDAVILSDYSKGVLTPALCKASIATAKANGIPILVDPKGLDWSKYRHATTITPNRSELAAVSKVGLSSIDTVIREANRIREELDLNALTVTLSEEGMVHVDADHPVHVPAMALDVFDVSGAGDTAIATLTCCCAHSLDWRDSLLLANIAAGIVVGKVGTVPLERDELLTAFEASLLGRGHVGKHVGIDEAQRLVRSWKRRNEKVVFTNGCFDILHAGHVSYLDAARRLGDRLVLGLNSDASVRRLKGASRPINPQEHRAAVLASLAAVDVVVLFEEDDPRNLIQALRPDVLAKGADYRKEQVIGASEVESWGGEVKLVELVDGVSTTRIAARIAGGSQS